MVEVILGVEELTEERDNLKEIVFDLMFEKQRVSDPDTQNRWEDFLN